MRTYTTTHTQASTHAICHPVLCYLKVAKVLYEWKLSSVSLFCNSSKLHKCDMCYWLCTCSWFPQHSNFLLLFLGFLIHLYHLEKASLHGHTDLCIDYRPCLYNIYPVSTQNSQALFHTLNKYMSLQSGVGGCQLGVQ